MYKCYLYVGHMRNYLNSNVFEIFKKIKIKKKINNVVFEQKKKTVWVSSNDYLKLFNVLEYRV